MPDLGAINNVYRGALDADAGHGVSPQGLYAYLVSQGANRNEALLLSGAGTSESRLNPGAVHDDGKGYGLFGHQGSRLLEMKQYAADRGQDLSDWRTQAAFALQELRSRPEGRAASNATTPEQLALAQVHYEQPQGFTPSNPEGAHNYTGRLNQIRLYTSLDPNATGSFAPSANPQVTPQQMAHAAPAGLGNASDADLNQKIAALEAQIKASQSNSGYRPPLVSQLLGMALNPVRDAISDGLTSLLGGGGARSSLGATPPSPSAAPVAGLPPPSGSTAGAVPLAPPPPAPAASFAPQQFAAAGLPAPQQPVSASIAPASPLPTFAQGGALSGLASLLGGAAA